jgi:hypothetical protein
MIAIKKQLSFVFTLCLVFAISLTGLGKTKSNTKDTTTTNHSIILCKDSAAIQKIITDAISLGAPIYNTGLYIGCYRVYEWAAYKIIYVYGSSCPEAEKILKAAVDQSHSDYSDTEKAWIMRAAFDKILGEPTQFGDPVKDPQRKDKPLKG